MSAVLNTTQIMADVKAPGGSFAGTQLIAALLIAAAVAAVHVLAVLRPPPTGTGKKADRRWGARKTHQRGGLLMGYDKRMSTSKTMALAWTVVLAYMVLTIALIARSQGASYFKDIFSNAPELYLVLLGGPYAAAVLAKVSVVSKLDSGRMQKADGDNKLHPADLTSNDTGATDLYDFQYTLFNLIGLLAVVALFWSGPGKGLPPIPSFLAILLGGSALTYTVNKAAQSNAPAITDVTPGTARIGETVTIAGSNLYMPTGQDDKAPKTVVTVGGVEAPLAGEPQSDLVAFKVPPPKTGTAWDTSQAQDVKITTTAGATAVKPGALAMVEDRPYVDGLKPQQAILGQRLTLSGRFFYSLANLDADGRPTAEAPVPTVRLAWTDDRGDQQRDLPADTNPTPGDTTLTITIPADLADAQRLPSDLNLEVRRDGKRSNEVTIPVTKPANAPVIIDVHPNPARVGGTVALSGINLGSAAAKPIVTVAGAETPLDGAGQGDLIRFKVPPPKVGVAWDASQPQEVKVAVTTGAFTVHPGGLTIEDDVPKLEPIELPEQAHLGGLLTLSGRNLYAAPELDVHGMPIPNAHPPSVHLAWNSRSGQQTQDLSPAATPVPSDSQIAVTIPADLVDPNLLPISANVSVTRNGQQSNEIAVTLAS
jgi:hypothetical protein